MYSVDVVGLDHQRTNSTARIVVPLTHSGCQVMKRQMNQISTGTVPIGARNSVLVQSLLESRNGASLNGYIVLYPTDAYQQETSRTRWMNARTSGTKSVLRGAPDKDQVEGAVAVSQC